MAHAGGGAALQYPYRYLARSLPACHGLDLDGNGEAGGNGRARGNDAWGYGLHPGQYGMLVLSKYPIDAAQVRTFRLLRWSAMPDALRPVDPASGGFFYPDAVWKLLRLSSKSHWDVPVRTPQGVVLSSPRIPRRGVRRTRGPQRKRNHDEIRLWSEYISPGRKDWLCDDQGRCDGLAADARFVIAGDLNNDPVDGDGLHQAIVELLEHPRVLRHATPRSQGGGETALAYAAQGIAHRGSPQHVTGDFGPKAGTMRLDYVLPSTGFGLLGQRRVLARAWQRDAAMPTAATITGLGRPVPVGAGPARDAFRFSPRAVAGRARSYVVDAGTLRGPKPKLPTLGADTIMRTMLPGTISSTIAILPSATSASSVISISAPPVSISLHSTCAPAGPSVR